jgi:hypothetical protein
LLSRAGDATDRVEPREAGTPEAQLNYPSRPGAPGLSPEEGWREDLPEIAWERPVCEDCGWAGQPIPVVVRSDDKVDKIITRVGHNNEEHVIPTVPLMRLDRPGDT